MAAFTIRHQESRKFTVFIDPKQVQAVNRHESVNEVKITFKNGVVQVDHFASSEFADDYANELIEQCVGILPVGKL